MNRRKLKNVVLLCIVLPLLSAAAARAQAGAPTTQPVRVQFQGRLAGKIFACGGQYGVLGAPVPTVRPRFSLGLLALILVFSVYLPMLGASLALVLVTERVVLRRIPSARRWLGLWSEAATVVSIR